MNDVTLMGYLKIPNKTWQLHLHSLDNSYIIYNKLHVAALNLTSIALNGLLVLDIWKSISEYYTTTLTYSQCNMQRLRWIKNIESLFIMFHLWEIGIIKQVQEERLVYSSLHHLGGSLILSNARG